MCNFPGFNILNITLLQEVESICLKLLAEVGTKKDITQTLGEATRFFNTNVSYSGLAHAVTEERLFAENKERLINNALGALVIAEVCVHCRVRNIARCRKCWRDFL